MHGQFEPTILFQNCVTYVDPKKRTAGVHENTLTSSLTAVRNIFFLFGKRPLPNLFFKKKRPLPTICRFWNLVAYNVTKTNGGWCIKHSDLLDHIVIYVSTEKIQITEIKNRLVDKQACPDTRTVLSVEACISVSDKACSLVLDEVHG